MTFLEWILNRLRNNSDELEPEIEQVPLTIEAPRPPERHHPKIKDEKDNKKVIIIDI